MNRPFSYDLEGRRFSRLVVQWPVGRNGAVRHVRWLCVCDCGNLAIVDSGNFRRVKSCGYLRKEGLPSLKHGHARSTIKTKEYMAWLNMRRRCHDPNNPAFKYYGGRGITVCPRWNDSFEAFLADMGRKPSPNLSIDRINNDGNYEPANCRWATRDEQSDNQRKVGRFAGVKEPRHTYAAIS